MSKICYKSYKIFLTISFFSIRGHIHELLMLRTSVIPAKAGIQNILKSLDSGLRRNDREKNNCLFFERLRNIRELKTSIWAL